MEYGVKAAFLLNFTKFIEWPPTAFAQPGAPFTICVLGEDPFGRMLDNIVAGETANGRRLVVERLRRPPVSGCQVLFVARSEKDPAKILQGAGPGVLTVGETESFLQDGGVIALLLENRRVRFDVNLRAAENSGVTISSKLLNVARSVKK